MLKKLYKKFKFCYNPSNRTPQASAMQAQREGA